MRDIVGNNRSGALRFPEMTRELLAATQEFPPSSEGDAEEIAAVRIAYAQNGEPAATMPPPLGVVGLAKNALGALRGHPNLLLDKLGERLAYERSGVRLYDALLSKVDAYGTFRGGPSREDVTHIRDEELDHFHLLAQTIERLGGDPTAVTPSANVQAVASRGMCAVLVDPRTNLLQSLEIVQMIELADNDCWAALIELAQAGGDSDAVEAFGEALEHEREHLERVRAWVAAGQGRSGDGTAGAREASVRAPSKRTARDRRGAKATRGRSSASGAGVRPKRASSDGRSAANKRSNASGRTKGGRKPAKVATTRSKGRRTRRATER